MSESRFVVRIDAMVGWVVVHHHTSGTYVGVCKSLNLNAAGDTMEEFLDCANEAIELLFADLYETQELDAFLQEQGWTRTGLPDQGQIPHFDIPLEIQHTRYGVEPVLA